MSRTSLLAIFSSVLLLLFVFKSNSKKTTDEFGKAGLGSSELLKKNETNKVDSDLDTFDKTPTSSVIESVSDATTTPDSGNGSQAADRIWGKVIATSENKLFRLNIHTNAACEILPISSRQFFSKNGADPFRPRYGTNWPSGVGIKIRSKTGEIVGMKSGFSSGWMNPNWGGSGHAIEDKLVPMYSDGFDLSKLMKHLIPRISTELTDNSDMSQLEFKLKVFTSRASIFKGDGTAVPPAELNDFESDWISGRHLEVKP